MNADEFEVRAHIERLERVKRRPELLERVPRVVAAGFGVIPVGYLGDTLELFATQGLPESVEQALPRILGVAVQVQRVREALVHVYLGRLYPKEPNINFHTFETADFLDDPAAWPDLIEEKPYEPVPTTLDPDPGKVTFLDYAYRSYLTDLDGRQVPQFEAGDLDLKFAILGNGLRGRVVMHREEPLPPEVPLVISESRSNVGIEHTHGWKGHEITELPFMVHPTEIQVVGVHNDGAIDLFVYDRVERVRPGETPRFEIVYHYMS
ncbi:MAG: hypothetical protein ACYS22_14605, partial [Planctomycetota bacterium]